MTRDSQSSKDNQKSTRKPINYCFGCGQANPEGLRLRFELDEENRRAISEFRLSKRFVGPPGHAHGGIIATILDEAMGKVTKFRQVRAMTCEMTVRYLKPVPLGRPLVAEGRELRVRGRLHTNVGEIRDEHGQLLASSEGKFLVVDLHKVLAKTSAKAPKRPAK
jgi:uncharacterized protein (TIGR00369 family)